MTILDAFEKFHSSEDSILWYSKYNLIFKDFNAALWTNEIREILSMRFLIRSLSRRLKQSHQSVQQTTTFFCGQHLPNTNFEQICLQTGGLFSFNCFLSASRSRRIEKFFSTTDFHSDDSTQVAVFVQIHIEPQASNCTLFAPIEGDDEILFSTSSTFRVGRIDQLEENVWQVNLLSITDQDVDLKQLMHYIRKATRESNELERLSSISD